LRKKKNLNPVRPDFFLNLMSEVKAIYKLGKTERARNKKVVQDLFAKGAPSLTCSGFRFTYIFLKKQPAACQVLFISSRKKLKTAVLRNRRKRLLREMYRLNKLPLLSYLEQNQLFIALSLNFVGADELDFHLHTPKFKKALQQLILEFQKNTDSATTTIG
jgi:ribonuclease P protein component